jgi:hypothetical protein
VSKRLLFLVLCLVSLLAAGCGASGSTGVTASLGAKSLPDVKPPAFVPGPLDGESTPRILAMRRPLGVIIENYAPDSRPQSGLSQASVVFETLAEAGITRFFAVYLEKDAKKVGPIRSTRMYFDNWAASLHTILTHVGGNDDAQALLWHLPRVFNIDENRWEISLYNTGTPLFWRSADRVAPHNMYASTYKLRQYAVRSHQNWAYSNAYFVHKHPAPPAQRGHVKTISITFQDPLNPQPEPAYDVQYRYDRASNTYLRIMGGTPHVDVLTGKALRPANVVVMRTDPAVSDPAAGITPESILIRNIGIGPAYFFRDGTVLQGRWQQVNRDAPLRFFDRRGHQVAFNPGQTWIELVPRGCCDATWSGR